VSLLEIRRLSVLLGQGEETVAALSEVDLSIERGEVLGLVGESGAGKSMLARAITGLLPAGARTQGQVLFDGRDVLTMSPRELSRHRGRGAAMCFQNPRGALSPARRVGAQLVDRLETHGGRSSGNGGADRPGAALELFEAVGIRNPQQRLRAYPHELSGGMAQRVMISLALACTPKLLLADEPTTGLDVTLTRDVLGLLRRAADEESRGVLIVSHDLAAIAEVCDRIAVLYAGMLVEDGPAAALLDAPAHPYTRALLEAAPDLSGAPIRALGGSMPTLRVAPGDCPFSPRCPRAETRCREERPPTVQPVPGRLSACFFAGEVLAGPTAVASEDIPATPSARPAATPLVSLEDVEVVYGSRFTRRGHPALRGISIDVGRGETLGIVGESGCGKSTLARVIMGLVHPTAGRVTLDGIDIGGLRGGAMRQLRRRMQMVFQDPIDSLNPRRAVEDTLADSLRLLDLPRREVGVRIDEALARVGLDRSLRTRRRSQLSGGQAQRVGIARALILDPELVVFDEPTSALDVTVQAQILDLIESLTAERERSYVYISHDLATVRRVCDRVVVLYLGEVVEQGAAEEVFDRPLHPYTRALLSSVPSLQETPASSAPVALERDLQEADTQFGCVLTPRCPFSTERCAAEAQELTSHGGAHLVACWRAREVEGVPGRREPARDAAKRAGDASYAPPR
jgi:peptide/nickel transport system ATP-binding protein